MRLESPISAIGFDIDHTLTPPSGRVASAVLENFEHVIHDIVVGSIELYDGMKRAYQDLGLNQLATNAYLVAIRDYLRDEKLGVTREAHSMIEVLAAQNVSLYTVSNAPGDKWGRRLTKSIRPHIQCALFSEDVDAPKADPAGILTALQRINSPDPANSLYVGNAATDMKAAISAGVIPVAMGRETSAGKYLTQQMQAATLAKGVILSNWQEFGDTFDFGFEGHVIGYEYQA